MFYGRFMSYFPLFWGSKRICKAYMTRYMFGIYDLKHVVLAFYGRFHEPLPSVLGLWSDLQRPYEPIHVGEI